MKHKIIDTQNLPNNNAIVICQLFPDNEIEIRAIQNIEKGECSFEERDLIDNYLLYHFSKLNYSIKQVINQKGEYFYIDVYKN